MEKAAREGKVRALPRFGEKTEENILRSIELSREHRGRFLLGYVSPIVSEIEKDLASSERPKIIDHCGSIRRRKETVGDIDILAAAENSAEIMEYFASMSSVEKVIASGDTKSSVRLDIGIDSDLRVVPEKSFGAAMQYFTGNKDHNVELRKIAMKYGWKLNEYGLFDKNNKIMAGRTEEEIYKKIGSGLDAAGNARKPGRDRTGTRPKIAQNRRIRRSFERSADAYDLFRRRAYGCGNGETAAKLGRKYIAITDHVGHLKIAGAMDVKTIEKQWREIEKVDKAMSGIKILKGCEVDINPDGTIALEDKYLAKFDIVLASIHSNFKMPKADQTKRLIRAIENPHVDIIAHPTGRIIHQRSGYEFDFEEICQAAARTKTILEANCYPDRLDLNDLNIRRAIDHGVKISFGTDSHSKNQLHYLDLGIAQARRGWATKKDCVNKFKKKKKKIKERFSGQSGDEAAGGTVWLAGRFFWIQKTVRSMAMLKR